MCFALAAGAHNGAYSSLIATGPIANSVADLTLLYAVMANVTYPAADARKPGAASLSLPGVPEAAAAAAATPPRPLGLPHVLLEVPEDAASSKDQVALADLKPLDGLRVGVFPKVRAGSLCVLGWHSKLRAPYYLQTLPMLGYDSGCTVVLSCLVHACCRSPVLLAVVFDTPPARVF